MSNRRVSISFTPVSPKSKPVSSKTWNVKCNSLTSWPAKVNRKPRGKLKSRMVSFKHSRVQSCRHPLFHPTNIDACKSPHHQHKYRAWATELPTHKQLTQQASQLQLTHFKLNLTSSKQSWVGSVTVSLSASCRGTF